MIVSSTYTYNFTKFSPCPHFKNRNLNRDWDRIQRTTCGFFKMPCIKIYRFHQTLIYNDKSTENYNLNITINKHRKQVNVCRCKSVSLFVVCVQ